MRITDPRLRGADCKSAPATLNIMGLYPQELGSILKLQRKTTFQTEYKTVALGWDEFKFGDNEAISGFLHGGGTGGYSSIFILDVNNKLAVVILTNVSAFFPGNEKISILGFELLRNLYNNK